MYLRLSYSVLVLLLCFTRTVGTQKESHGIYISVVEIDHRNIAENAAVRLKVFTDDLENALRNKYKKSFTLIGKNGCNTYDDDIEDYFRKHLNLRVNTGAIDITLDSCEENGDSLWLTFSTSAKGDWSTVEVKADYFMELFPAQSNVVSVYYGEQKLFLRLTVDKKSDQLTFSD